jgi:hypothetical protein
MSLSMPLRVSLSLSAVTIVVLTSWAVAAAVPDEQLSRKVVGGVGFLVLAAALSLLWGGRWLTIAAAMLGLAGYADLSIVRGLLPDGPHRIGELAHCAGARLNTSMSGQIDDEAGRTGALVYVGADNSRRAETRYPAGCSLDFEGYCVGQPVRDLRLHAPNSVWYVVRRRELLPAASVSPIVRPLGIGPSTCVGSAPQPLTPTIVEPRRTEIAGVVRFVAAAPYAQMVGFAAYYQDVPGDARTRSWHRISVDRSVSGGFHVRWDTLSAQPIGRSRRMRVIVAAVPCLALDFPAFAQTFRHYTIVPATMSRAPHRVAAEVTLDPEQRTLARRAACRNPHA